MRPSSSAVEHNRPDMYVNYCPNVSAGMEGNIYEIWCILEVICYTVVMLHVHVHVVIVRITFMKERYVVDRICKSLA